MVNGGGAGGDGGAVWTGVAVCGSTKIGAGRGGKDGSVAAKAGTGGGAGKGAFGSRREGRTAGVSAAYMQGYRMLLGSDMRYIAPFGTTFRAEYAGGVFEASPDRSQYLKGNHAQAWLVSAKHPINRRLDLAVKYDEYMPISQSGVRFGNLDRSDYIRKTLQGGLLYYMDEATRFRLWYTRGLTPYDPSAAGGPARARLGLITGEIQVSY